MGIVDKARNSSLFWGAAYFGATPAVGARRIYTAITEIRKYNQVKLLQTSSINALNDDSHAKISQLQKTVGVITPNGIKKFWYLEIVRGITEIIFPIIAAIFWTIKDIRFNNDGLSRESGYHGRIRVFDNLVELKSQTQLQTNIANELSVQQALQYRTILTEVFSDLK